MCRQKRIYDRGGGEILPLTISVEALKHSDQEPVIWDQKTWWFKALLHHLVIMALGQDF